MGVRPEHLHITPNGWDATIETVELLGAERLIYARIGNEQVIVRQEEGKPSPAVGDAVRISLEEDRVHWFDTDTGKRLL